MDSRTRNACIGNQRRAAVYALMAQRWREAGLSARSGTRRVASFDFATHDQETSARLYAEDRRLRELEA